MNFFWFVLFAVAALLMKENSCVPAIRPLSQRGILFPADNKDDCFLDEASTQPGMCKRIEECTEALKEWNKEDIYPKTCYFIKQQEFICCPIAATKETFTSTEENFDNIFNKNAVSTTTTPSNNFLDFIDSTIEEIFTKTPDGTKTTTRTPSNIFLENLHQSTTPATSRPSNIFLDNVEKTTSQMPPPSAIADIFNTQKPSIGKRRSELDCDYKNQRKFETSVINGTVSKKDEFPFMGFLVWKQNEDYEVWYPCSGILISPKFVLTVAHCADIGGESPSFINFGDVTDSLEGTYHIKRIIEYPGYDVTSVYKNIALVELEQEVNKPLACLWTQHDLPTSQVTALGYGRTSFDGLKFNQIFKVSVTVNDKETCHNHHKLVDTLLCVGIVVNSTNWCQHDTGVPLIMELEERVYVVGLISFGLGCSTVPSIYTRVSSYIDWIEQIVWPKMPHDIQLNGE